MNSGLSGCAVLLSSRILHDYEFKCRGGNVYNEDFAVIVSKAQLYEDCPGLNCISRTFHMENAQVKVVSRCGHYNCFVGGLISSKYSVNSLKD